MEKYCIVKMCFDSIEEVRRCVAYMTNDKLLAYALVMRSGSYRLELDGDGEISGYVADENALGYPSADKKDDIMLEVYTTVRLAGKIREMAEREFPVSSESMLTVPILEASKKLREMVKKLNAYHSYEDNLVKA